MNPMIRRALVSVHDKAGVREFCEALHARGIALLSTGGTLRHLVEGGLPVVAVSEVTGFPEILGGRVKTLHPRIHGGILARRDREDDRATLREQGIDAIDLVVVSLYPFERAAADPSLGWEEVVEEIDIGGPAMIRAAAKNHRHVAVVVERADYATVLEEMAREEGALTEATRRRLASKAFARVSAYDAAIASWLSRSADPGSSGRVLFLEKVMDLRYGENPHQKAALYTFPGAPVPSLASAEVLQGKQISYNNLLDLDAALALLAELSKSSKPLAVIVKHNNPCGAAYGVSLAESFRTARDCDPLSAFGGVIALSGEVDAGTAREIASAFYEVVAAPGWTPEAREVLSAKKGLRLLTVPAPDPGRRAEEARFLWGGVLLQDRDAVDLDEATARVVTKRQPTPEEWQALRFGWKVVKHVRSNAIVFTGPDRILAVGAGQTSRVDSVACAIRKAGEMKRDLAGSIVASDAFFPFRDGLDLAARAGATAAIQPGGSVRDTEVIAAADEHGMAMVFTGIRHFRH